VKPSLRKWLHEVATKSVPVSLALLLMLLLILIMVSFAPRCDANAPELRIGHVLLAGCAK
jgi:hypothetical protein